MSKIFQQEEFEGRYVVHESYNQNNDYSHQSILELPKVDVQYVGYYYCVKNLSDVENNNLETLVEHTYASKIYLFVEGKNNSHFTFQMAFFVIFTKF